MRINKNPKKGKAIDQEGIVYALTFTLYIIVLILVFIYVIDFLRGTINTVLDIPTGTAIESKYGQLDLENYSLVAGKLGLKKLSPAIIVTPIATSTDIVTPIATSTEIQTATTSLPVISTSTIPDVATVITVNPTPIIAATVTPVITTPQLIEQRPTIVVTNSTIKAGLASDLKNKLIAAGYSVLGTGNSRPSLANTVIKIKNSYNQNSSYLTEIKKIVSVNYDFVLGVLDEKASSDIEIIIGNK